MGFQHIRPTTGAPPSGVHVVQVVRRGGGGDLNNNPPDPQYDVEAESLSIRNESGESLEDLVSIMSSDEVEVYIEDIEIFPIITKCCPPEPLTGLHRPPVSTGGDGKSSDSTQNHLQGTYDSQDCWGNFKVIPFNREERVLL